MWPPEVQEVRYPARVDSTDQPAMFYAPKSRQEAPLLLALHTWSHGYQSESGVPYAEWCIKNGWTMIHPDFRGPNRRPEACCSEIVFQDILDAVDYCRAVTKVDTKRIYMMGGSGGGMAALYMAGRVPEVWAAVSAWVPLFDLTAWRAESVERENRYATETETCCGGAPGDSAAADRQYELRSPKTWLARAAALPIDINVGISDGHTGSLPIHHSLHAFNLLAAPEDRLSEEEIAYFVENQSIPPHLQHRIADRTYGEHTPLFRRTSGCVRLTIFQGGHDIVFEAGLTWLSKQRNAASCRDRQSGQ